MKRLRHFTENRVSICTLYESYLPCVACPYCTYFYNTGEANYCVIAGGLDELDEFVPLRE